MVDKKTKRAAAFLNRPLSEIVYLGNGVKKGELYGLELELEGRNVAMQEVPTKGWKRVKDGSLRGESIEYIFTAPADKKVSIQRVNELFKLFVKHGVRLNNSYRTSTHVHVNFSDRTLKDCVNFFVLYTILEELLEVYCGDQRKGNLFCLSSRDVEPIVRLLEDSIMNANIGHFGENIRYCAANLAALNKFGTIELRTMRGADTAEQVIDWLEIVSQLYQYACNDMESPARLIESLSFRGPIGFLQQFFDAKTANKLADHFSDHGGRDLHASLYEGARLVQMLAYRLDEAFTLPKEKLIVDEDADDKKFVITQNNHIVQVPDAMAHGFPRGYEYVDGAGVRLAWYPNENRWLDVRRGIWTTWCDEFGNKIIVGKKKAFRLEIPRVPDEEVVDARPRLIYCEEVGRIFLLTRMEWRHGHKVTGVGRDIRYDARFNLWRDWDDGGAVCKYCDQTGAILNGYNYQAPNAHPEGWVDL